MADPPVIVVGVDPARLNASVAVAVERINRTFGLMTVAMAGAAVTLGDRLRVSYDPNSLRRIVESVYDRHHYGIATYRRPSRGYRRHVRRVKAAERRRSG